MAFIKRGDGKILNIIKEKDLSKEDFSKKEAVEEKEAVEDVNEKQKSK
jgi:hypothetical protein